jgi:lipopolysaccharide export LptBFGC system permease protein LptF
VSRSEDYSRSTAYILGGIVIAAVYGILLIGWNAFFANSSWRGDPIPQGPPFFGTTPRSLYFFNTVMSCASFFLAMSLIRRGKRPQAAFFFFGALTVAFVVWLVIPQLHDHQHAVPIDLMILVTQIGFPILIGRGLAGAFTETAIGRRFLSRIPGASYWTE